jgi:hypothetical protein
MEKRAFECHTRNAALGKGFKVLCAGLFVFCRSLLMSRPSRGYVCRGPIKQNTENAVWSIAGNVQHHTHMASLSPCEQRIVNLCAKALAAQDSEDLGPAMHELRAALHEHLQTSRDNLADMALLVAAHEESQAAD